MTDSGQQQEDPVHDASGGDGEQHCNEQPRKELGYQALP